MAAMRASFEARSKMPPEIVELPLEIRQLAPELAEHGPYPRRPSARPPSSAAPDRAAQAYAKTSPKRV